MRLSRKMGVAGAAMTATIMGVAGLAWACTAYLMPLHALQVSSGRPGTTVAVTGVASQNGMVEVHWNSVGGPVVGRAPAEAGRDFSVPVVIPESAPGVSYLVAVSGADSVGRAAFEVTAPAGDAAQAASATAARGEVWPSSNESRRDPLAVRDASSSVGAGMLLLTLGAAAMFAGFALAVVGRRRATVSPRS